MVTATFLYKSEISFNEEYYLTRHLPLAEELLKPLGLRRLVAQKIQGLLDGTPAVHQYSTTLFFDSLEALQDFLQHPITQEAVQDIPNFYSGMPEIVISRVIAEF
jgi:uncharacterized protein (TIGR02118 family)